MLGSAEIPRFGVFGGLKLSEDFQHTLSQPLCVYFSAHFSLSRAMRTCDFVSARALCARSSGMALQELIRILES